MAQITTGCYRIDNEGCNGDKKRVLDLKGSGSDPTLVTCYPETDASNQKWSVTELKNGYSFHELQLKCNAFISNVGPGAPVTATPSQNTVFKLRDTSGNQTFQIIALTDDGDQYAFEASADGSKPVTLEHLDATNKYQIWTFHKL